MRHTRVKRSGNETRGIEMSGNETYGVKHLD